MSGHPNKSLCELYPRRWDIVLLILMSLGLLCYALFLPIIKFKTLFLWTDTFSVITGIEGLKESGYLFLAGLLFVFSILFPFTKLLTLLLIWFLKMDEKQRQWLLYWLGILGKWSMMDVFVVALTVVLVKAGRLVNAEPQTGIYVFGAAVFSSMIVTMLFDSIAAKSPRTFRPAS